MFWPLFWRFMSAIFVYYLTTEALAKVGLIKSK